MRRDPTLLAYERPPFYAVAAEIRSEDVGKRARATTIEM
jgi:hypothetical protein